MPRSAVTYASTLRLVNFRCLMHLTILFFQSFFTYSVVDKGTEEQSPEEVHGVLSRVLFTWIIPILFWGYTNVLVDIDLQPLSQDIKPDRIRYKMIQAWSSRGHPETYKSLPFALLKCVKSHFLAAILPRMFLTIFRYSQPILIQRSIRYIASYPKKTNSSDGYWLLASAVGIYTGLAISTSIYGNCVNRLELATKSALVGLIHDHTMSLPSVSYDDGEATTLMSTDADGLVDIGTIVHETWAQVMEVIIGMILLASEVGWIWPLLLVLIYLCSHMSRFVAKRLRPFQKEWNNTTQSRIAATASMLGSMKVIKMLGFQHSLTRCIGDLRNQELRAAAKLRWVMVLYNASANALGIFSPAITLVIFAVMSKAQGHSLDTESAFTTMAILSMVTHPANMVMTIVPRAIAAFAGFDRIQTFILRPSLRDTRERLPESTAYKSYRNSTSVDTRSPKPAIRVDQLRIGDQQPILDNIKIDVASGSLFIISGITGSGKSTLLRAILGEVIPSRGTISTSAQRIAYCSQRPWLPSGSIKQVIHGYTGVSDNSPVDETWYRKVTEACCLIRDFDSLPDGDETQIGSRGLKLSGGQRQRVALARAVFARCDIILLDDTFSGLDGETEQTVFDHLLGPKGLMRHLKTTVVLVSNSSQYFQIAEHVVVLGDNKIMIQGDWQTMKTNAKAIAKFSSPKHDDEEHVLSQNYDRLRAQTTARDEAEIDLSRQTGDSSLYSYYFSFIGFGKILALVATAFTYSFFITVPQYWLELWTGSKGTSTSFYVLGFLTLSMIAWISTSAQTWILLTQISPQSGSRIHQHLLKIITCAPLFYFSKTENGAILNRFSQDIQLIDKKLPLAVQTILVQEISKLFMQVILLFHSQKLLAFSLPVSMLLVYIIQKLYLRTSRQLRFLELESQAAVFSSYLESLEGLETIRSFGWSKAVMQHNTKCVDKSQRPEFLLRCLQRWLNLVLDLLAAAIAISVIALAVLFQEQISGAKVGVALNVMLVANTTLLKLVESWTTLEVSLGAVARLKTLEDMTPIEGGISSKLDPPDSWPSKGHVEFRNVTASYGPESLALRNISLNIPAGQRLVVCGRTGSGKSTLLATLLRLLELQSGTIEIDGVDIKNVTLDLLRQRCFITVSQDPLILLNETLRFNLDPESFASDNVLIDCLRKVGLWPHLASSDSESDGLAATVINLTPIDEHQTLDQKISQFKDLSVGQCQLLALSRAIIKASSLRLAGIQPVIILDEVTSSLDLETESTIYRIIDEEFTDQGLTVVIVAHRLGVLTKYMRVGRDDVVFMADGVVGVDTSLQALNSDDVHDYL
ncbi:related to multidrug resistance protein [Rhynchosporium graminicola]|uniref:Related to multidrug resistance protein n=1 Tax=Rhynchosporium graminicola TaxID=2792576 RepID=A0A1E1JWX4_9HELO|nr:related to multidrug resistance protein [Rhynchosporium commune]